MAIILNARQIRAYTDRFDVYRHEPWDNNDEGYKPDPVYSTTPVFKMLPALWMNHPDINRPMSPLGIMLADASDVLDVVHVPLGAVIKSGDALHLRTPGHPQKGDWFIVMGFGAARQARGGRQGNYSEVRIKRTTAPMGLEDIEI